MPFVWWKYNSLHEDFVKKINGNHILIGLMFYDIKYMW